MKTIKLTQGKGALIDDTDFDWLSLFKWQACMAKTGVWYAQRTVQKNLVARSIIMHREIAGASRGQLVDHRNGDGLDNRRTNIRLCNRFQNGQNRFGPLGNTESGIRGVYRGSRNRWRGIIHAFGKPLNVGYFATKEAAMAAVESKRRELYGEFAGSSL